MKAINKEAVIQATANTLAKCKKKNRTSIPNYKVDVHISASNNRSNYNNYYQSKKRRK